MSKSLSLLTLVLIMFAVQLQADNENGKRVKLPDEDIILPSSSFAPASRLSKKSAAMEQFLLANDTWEFRYNALTDNPHRAWGKGIQIDGYPVIHLLNAPQAANQFVQTYRDVLNADPDNLRLLYSEIVGGKAYVKYIQQYQGIDVLHSYIDLRISSTGKVFMFGSDTHPGIRLNPTPTLSRESARSLSKSGLDRLPDDGEIEGGTLVVLPLKYPASIDYRLVYNFLVRESGHEVWDTYVDAHSGQILWRWNTVRHFHQGKEKPAGITSTVSGRVTIQIYPISYTKGVSTVPLKGAYVWVDGKMVITDEDGRYTVDIGTASSAQVIARLSGPFAIARRADTSGTTVRNGVVSGTVNAGQEFNIEWFDGNSVASERNGFYHVTRVHEYIRNIDPTMNLSGLDIQLPCVVNINQECNANWNGTSVNFFNESATCGNTAEIADVVYHEYGHAVNHFLYRRLRGSGMTNGALSEATADILANTLRDDPRVGIGFMKNGPNDGIIRNSDNTRRYPESIVNEIHDDGMILTGAVWDTRKAIGLEKVERLSHQAKYGTPDGTNLGVAFADYFIEFLVADDDDGNLSNGTPNSSQIIPAFNAHGIPGSAISIIHNPAPDHQSVTDPIALSGDAMVATGIDATRMKIQEVRVVYSSDDFQNQQTATLVYDAQFKRFSGFIPPHPAGSILKYYIEATDNFGSIARHPARAPISYHLVLVGFLTKEFYDCEVLDGWGATSDAETGRWVREKPIGTWNTQLGAPPQVPYVQPNEDHTPGVSKERCWVTGNADPSLGLGQNDVDGGSTWLTTRKYDVSAYIVPVLRYFRWYTNNSGATPGTDDWTVRISGDGGTTWKTLEQTKESDASWSPKVFRVKDYFPNVTELQVEFEAADLEPGSLVEAAVDDFELLDIDQSLVSVERDHARPIQLSLHQNFPNPFNPSTTITFDLPKQGTLSLRVFSAIGREVRTLADGVYPAGSYRVQFDSGDLPSGIYTYELQAAGQRLVKKMVLMK